MFRVTLGLGGMLLAAGIGPTAQAQSSLDAREALRQAERVYQNVTSLRADFVQTVDNPLLGAPESSEGTLVLRRPDRFALNFRDPEGDRIVADGTWLWLFNPSAVPDQVIRQPIPQSGPVSPNLFGQFVDQPEDRYVIVPLGQDTVGGQLAQRIQLTPRPGIDLPFRQVVLTITTSDGLIRALDLVEESGQLRTFRFSGIAPGAAVSASEVSFRPGRDVRVVTP